MTLKRFKSKRQRGILQNKLYYKIKKNTYLLNLYKQVVKFEVIRKYFEGILIPYSCYTIAT